MGSLHTSQTDIPMSLEVEGECGWVWRVSGGVCEVMSGGG